MADPYPHKNSVKSCFSKVLFELLFLTCNRPTQQSAITLKTEAANTTHSGKNIIGVYSVLTCSLLQFFISLCKGYLQKRKRVFIYLSQTIHTQLLCLLSQNTGSMTALTVRTNKESGKKMSSWVSQTTSPWPCSLFQGWKHFIYTASNTA